VAQQADLCKKESPSYVSLTEMSFITVAVEMTKAYGSYVGRPMHGGVAMNGLRIDIGAIRDQLRAERSPVV